MKKLLIVYIYEDAGLTPKARRHRIANGIITLASAESRQVVRRRYYKRLHILRFSNTYFYVAKIQLYFH